VTEVEILLRRGRLSAPLAFDLRAQGQHGAEALHVEARVGCQAEARDHQLRHGLLGHLRIEMQVLDERGGRLPLVRRVHRDSQ
jgi:hypothetical protein